MKTITKYAFLIWFFSIILIFFGSILGIIVYGAHTITPSWVSVVFTVDIFSGILVLILAFIAWFKDIYKFIFGKN